MNDFGAALATITDNATPADEAATRLRMTVSLMSAPSHAARRRSLRSVSAPRSSPTTCASPTASSSR
jgi:hypothetical protein